MTGSVCAYELLYRADDRHVANIDPEDEAAGDKATSFVISHLFSNLDIDMVIGSRPAYMNFTRNHLLQKAPTLLPKERIVIELLENTLVDEPLVDVVRLLSKYGYKFALDDFVFREELKPLIELADIIKIDVLNLQRAEIKDQLGCLKNFQGKLLAEKIEHRAQFLLCQELGFDYFQGYFLNYPEVIQGQTLSENKTHLLRLLAEFHDPDVKIQRVEEIILQIPSLSYRILRLANSAAMYGGRKIETLMDAIYQLGLAQIRDWIYLLWVSSLDNVSYDLLERTLIRAKMCQSLARVSGLASPGGAYTAGILSTLDIILNESMPSLLEKVHLSEELNMALLSRSGILGHFLLQTEYYEQGCFEWLEYNSLRAQDFSQAYIQGIHYAKNIMELLR